MRFVTILFSLVIMLIATGCQMVQPGTPPAAASPTTLVLASHDSFSVSEDVVAEIGLYNLTQDAAPVLVHFGPETVENYLLVRLDPPTWGQRLWQGCDVVQPGFGQQPSSFDQREWTSAALGNDSPSDRWVQRRADAAAKQFVRVVGAQVAQPHLTDGVQAWYSVGAIVGGEQHDDALGVQAASDEPEYVDRCLVE